MFLPDLAVVPEAALARDAHFVPVDRAELVVEIKLPEPFDLTVDTGEFPVG